METSLTAVCACAPLPNRLVSPRVSSMKPMDVPFLVGACGASRPSARRLLVTRTMVRVISNEAVTVATWNQIDRSSWRARPLVGVKGGDCVGDRNERIGEAERFVGEHYADVMRYCVRHAPAGLAEDAVQETFLRFVRARSRYREQGRARAYLITIARNVCTDMVRDRAMSWADLPEGLADVRGTGGCRRRTRPRRGACSATPRPARGAGAEVRPGAHGGRGGAGARDEPIRRGARRDRSARGAARRFGSPRNGARRF